MHSHKSPLLDLGLPLLGGIAILTTLAKLIGERSVRYCFHKNTAAHYLDELIPQLLFTIPAGSIGVMLFYAGITKHYLSEMVTTQ